MKSDAPPSADLDWRRLPTLPGHWPGLGHLVSFLWTTRRVCDRLRSEGRPLYRYRAPWVGRGVLWNAPEAVDIFRNQGTSSGHMGARVTGNIDLGIGRVDLGGNVQSNGQFSLTGEGDPSPRGFRMLGVRVCNEVCDHLLCPIGRLCDEVCDVVDQRVCVDVAGGSVDSNGNICVRLPTAGDVCLDIL